MRLWQLKTQDEIRERIFGALAQNVNYWEANILGVPASHLDSKVFYQDAPFLKDAPYISTLLHNPNHIGCHTLGHSESFFRGTQEIERELIELCAADILEAEPGSCDGYVASGGTEANIQAVWIYRNYFLRELGVEIDRMAILCSADTHYSMAKAADVLHLDRVVVPVEQHSRQISREGVRKAVAEARRRGRTHFIVVANMMTTMFGSVDDVDMYTETLEAMATPYRVHVDGAYGGFIYPFSARENRLSFANPNVSSITLDAHKMVQAPYGTGIFLIRKGLIQYANTREASYVEGEDYTLIGSRSGANAVAVWMILMKNGPYGWREKIFVLLQRTRWLCEQLDRRGIRYYRHPDANIVTLRAEDIKPQLARDFGLVPDDHHDPRWYKIVIMEHVTVEKLEPFVARVGQPLTALKQQRSEP